MNGSRRWLRRFGLALGLVVAALTCLAVGILATAEWQYRAALRNPVTPPPAVATASPDPNAPVLILLHGAGLNGHMWDAVRRDLDPAWRVIALDLPGHGARRGEVFTLAGASAAVAAAARSVAPAPVVLVGDSLGGYSAMAAAAALPQEQLRGLMLGGSSSNFGWGKFPGHLKDMVVLRVMSTFIDDTRFVAKALPVFGVSEADAPAILAGGVSVAAVPASGRDLIGVDFRAKLAAIRQPVLIVNGSGDARALAEEASFVAAAPQGTTYRFENCEHGVSMRRPAEFAAQLNAFVRRVQSMPPTPAQAPKP
jgi:pimeloyl-ACP methyl ester carboxylesterase